MKKVSKFLFAIAILFMGLGISVSLQSCGSASPDKVVADITAACPIDCEDGMFVTSAELKGNEVVLHFTLPGNADVASATASLNDDTQLKDFVKSLKEVAKLKPLVGLGVSAKVIMCNEEGTCSQVTIPADKLK